MPNENQPKDRNPRHDDFARRRRACGRPADLQARNDDGKLNPARIEVPAGQRIKIEVRNMGKGAAEFESVQLRKEKVLAPGADSFVVIAPLSPGEYKFFDDFHQQAQGVIVAK